MTPGELAELDADRAKARRVFVAWLVLSTLLTLAGNAAAAMLDSLPPLAVRLAVHLLPPAVALVGFHALTAFARAGAIHRAGRGLRASVRDAGPLYMAATAGVLLIAALAVVLSYAGLIELARAGGLTPSLARIWPLTIDLGIAVSTICLMVLRPISAADLRAARRATKASVAAPTPTLPAANLDESAAREAATSTASSNRGSEPRVSVRHTSELGASPTDSDDESNESVTVTQEHYDRAAPLTQRDVVEKPVSKPVSEIAEVLALLDADVSERRIAALLEWSTNTVAKVRKADAAMTAAALAPSFPAAI